MPDSPFEENGDLSQITAINLADIRLAAMNLLARREHSRWELLRKLRRRFPDEQLLATELQRLSDENLQSDERYAQGYAWQRGGRGYGPLRVQQEMRERGLSDRAIASAFNHVELDWFALATEALEPRGTTAQRPMVIGVGDRLQVGNTVMELV